MDNPFSLEGKRILVTGASSGIGRACAIQASRLGASIILTGRRIDALDEARSFCAGENHLVVSGDITSADFIAELAMQCGKIDGLVHAAGVCPMCPISVVTREHVEEVMRTNYYSFVELVATFSRRKNRNLCLSIVVISSISALAGWSGISAYSGSKGAVSSSVRSMAIELAGKGIRINAVCPSNIKTPMYNACVDDIHTKESEQKIVERQPLGLGDPNQVAWPVCFLLSNAASFITGVNLPVDGGYLAQ